MAWKKLTIVALCLGLLGPGWVWGLGPEQLQTKAEQALAKGDLRSATIHLKNLLKRKPRDAAARVLLGDVYLKLRNPAAAEKEYKYALRLGLRERRVLLALARSYLMQGRAEAILDEIEIPEGASAEFEAAVLGLRGRALQAQGKGDAARAAYQRALELDPKAVDAHLGLARDALTAERTDDALAQVDQVLEQEPDNQEAWLLRAELLRYKGDMDAALAAYDRLLDINPRQVVGWLGKAAIAIGRNDPDAAHPALDRALALAPNSPLGHYMRGLLAFRDGEPEVAAEEVQQVLRQAPDHLPSHLLMGALRYGQGQWEQAAEHLSTYVAHTPAYLPARKLLGAALVKTKQAEQAIDVLEPGREQAPQDPQLLALLGSAYVQQGEFAQGAELLEQAVELAPDVAAIRTQLGLSLLATGNTRGAVSELESAADLGLVQADFFLVIAHLQAKEFDQALEAARLLAQKLPQSPAPLNMMGAALVGKGDLEQARRVFEQALTLAPDKSAARINLARLELRADRPQQAIRLYREILEQRPRNAEALTGLAQLELKQGKTEQALTRLQQVHDTRPTLLKPNLMLARLYLSKKQSLNALQVMRPLAERQPDNALVQETLGLALAANKDLGGALDAFRLVVEKRPDYGRGWYLLALTQLSQGNHDAARPNLERALQLAPASLPIAISLAQLALRNKDLAGALELARQIQRTHPESAVGDRLAGDVYTLQGRLRAALGEYKRGYEKRPSRVLALRLYKLQSRMGQTEQAEQSLQAWIDGHPLDRQTGFFLASRYQASGRAREARQLYLQILRERPNDAAVLNNLAWLALEQGDPAALEYARRAYRVSPQEPRITDTLGWALVRHGQVGRGLALLQQAASKAPHEAEIRYHLVQALHAAGRREEARKELRRLLRDEQDFPGRDEAVALLAQWGQ